MSDYSHEVTNEGNVGSRTKDQHNIREIVQQIVTRAQKALKERQVSMLDIDGLTNRFDVSSGFSSGISPEEEARLENEAA